VKAETTARLVPAPARLFTTALARENASEARLRAVLDAALDAVIAMDVDDVITYWNPRAEAIFGWGRDEALGKRVADLIVPERHREAHRRGLKHFMATGEGPVLGRRIELQGLRRDGTEFPIELSITAIKERETYSFSAFVADISDRKRAEAELRRYADVFRNVQVGLNVWCLEDRDTPRSFRLMSTNPAAAHSLGVRTEDVVGKRMDEALPHLLDTDLPRQYREVILSGEGRDLGEVRQRFGEGGEEGVFSVKVFPLPGDCVGVAFENITERKRVTDELQRTEEQLRQSQKMEAVGRLAGGVAHDFNNSLGVILGYTELLMRQAAEGQKGKLEQILKATQRASGLTRQLLAFSRKQIVDPKVLDLNALSAHLEEMLGRLIGEDIDLAIVPGVGLGQVKVDPGQLEQVVMNLCVNARDAMPDGGLLRIETANVELDAGHLAGDEPIAAGRYVMLAVSDTGSGMDAHILSKIFEPFFTTKEEGKGTGLGLPMVYGIVKQAGGYVGVFSKIGQGTTFKIYLPRIDEPETAAEPEAAMPSRGWETILLVEDESSLRAIAREILEEHGYRVIEAGGADEAIEVAGRSGETIHLLVTDVVMPRMNGRVLAESLRAARPDLRVLYMSGLHGRHHRASRGAERRYPVARETLHRAGAPRARARGPRGTRPGRERMSAVAAIDRMRTGISGLDQALCGGLPRGRTTLVLGSTGAGKTIFGLQTLASGAALGEAGVLVTFEESPQDILANLSTFTWAPAGRAQKRLSIMDGREVRTAFRNGELRPRRVAGRGRASLPAHQGAAYRVRRPRRPPRHDRRPGAMRQEVYRSTNGSWNTP
jgi:PAS domain S-box-containing protein